MSPQDVTAHPYLRALPRGFTVQVYERLEDAKKRHVIESIPAQQTPTGGCSRFILPKIIRQCFDLMQCKYTFSIY